jgi:crotonobetainyl-CoA:carnitine CoA-transferase CaiB-like acyl-CoA transferase
VLEDEQFKYREFFITLKDESHGKLKYAGDPFKFVGREFQNLTNSPKLSADTKEILSTELSMSESDIEKLKASNTI